MRAMQFRAARQPLICAEVPDPSAGPGQVVIKVAACGVCRTDLHILDGELAEPKLPLVPGHEIVGRVVALGPEVSGFSIGDRVGIPWLAWACGACHRCLAGDENLCDQARFTGYDTDGGYAEFAVADHRYCFLLPRNIDDVAAAPLLCAGLIGYRAFRLAGPVETLGIYGFGAAAHILVQVAVSQGIMVFAFTREGDGLAQGFALQLGASWAGPSTALPPVPLDAAIIFAPVGELVPLALSAVRKGGRVVCAGIHMSDIPTFPYRLLWGERSISSVANLTRRDAVAFFQLLEAVPVTIHPVPYDLEHANEALADLRAGRINGAAVLTMRKV